MANINEEARIPVYINDEQAKSALKNLTSEAEKWRKKMYEAMEGGDMKGLKAAEAELKKVNKSMSDIRREAFDVNKVLSNISDASIKDLKKALSTVNREMDGLNRNSKEYQALAAKRTQIKDEFNKINGVIKTQGGLMSNLVGQAKSMLPAFGFAAIAAGAVAAFGKIKNSTDTLGTAWDAAVNGMSEGLNYFWRTIATGDWSNFTDRMREAISLGAEYIYTLDDIEDKTRSLSVIEAEARAKQLKLEEDLKNVGLSNAERLAAGKERIKMEEDLAAKRTSLAQEAFNIEAKLTAHQTGLSKERLMGIIRDFDSESKVRAKAYNEKLKELDRLKKENVSEYINKQGLVLTTELPETDQMKQLKSEIKNTTDATKLYAEQIRATGNTTDEQLEKMVASYVKLVGAQNSAVENIKKVRTMVNSVTAAETRTNDTSGAKSTKTNAALFAPDAEEDIDMSWILARVDAEAKVFAEKKRSEEEWTAFLEKQIDERTAAMAKEFEIEAEMAEAKKKLKEAAIANAVETGMAAVENAQTIEEAGKAILNTIREQIKAYMAEAITVAALKALKSVPFPLNIVAAGVAGGVAGLLFNKLIPEFYEGGYTGQGNKYESAGIVHKNEYVIPEEGLRNPAVRQYANIIEIARRNNSLARLDLIPRINGFSSGGFTPNSQQPNGDSTLQRTSSGESLTTVLQRVANALDENSRQTRRLESWKPKVYTQMIKNDFDILDTIEKNRGL